MSALVFVSEHANEIVQADKIKQQELDRAPERIEEIERRLEEIADFIAELQELENEERDLYLELDDLKRLVSRGYK